jgi:hypothetical protein
MTAATVVDPTETTAFFCGGGPLGSCDDGPSLYSVITVPIKVQLNNPVLGSSCYIGSDADPIVLNLVETTTSTPQLTSGGPGGNAINRNLRAGGRHHLAVPGANGCGPLGALDSVLDLKVGLPSASGKNSALIDENAELNGDGYCNCHSDCNRECDADCDGYRHADFDLHRECDCNADSDWCSHCDANPRKVDRQSAVACVRAAGSGDTLCRQKRNCDQFDQLFNSNQHRHALR